MHPSTILSKTRLRLRDAVTSLRRVLATPSVEPTVANVFHCCVHKTGSQWVKRILGDPELYQLTGLKTYEYQADMPGQHDPRRVDDRSFASPFPLSTIVSPIYIDYHNYRDIPKRGVTRGFFVSRDPRDIVVSWYFSQRYSHGLMGDTGKVRRKLGDLDKSDGMTYAIRFLDEFGVFRAQRSWIEASDPTVLFVRFEDLIGPDSLTWFLRIFDHCEMKTVDVETARRLLDRYAFEKLSGRSRGDENVLTHFRKGVSGDWRNHFDQQASDVFHEVTGDLVELLGYDEN